jgi:hypothetical protein
VPVRGAEADVPQLLGKRVAGVRQDRAGVVILQLHAPGDRPLVPAGLEHRHRERQPVAGPPEVGVLALHLLLGIPLEARVAPHDELAHLGVEPELQLLLPVGGAGQRRQRRGARQGREARSGPAPRAERVTAVRGRRGHGRRALSWPSRRGAGRSTG